jgi:serine/threonine-protein kinase
MEYVDGKTLRQIVPVQKTQTAIDYAIQIGEALQEAHGKGIVHRDIKTDNIMVNTKNQVKVMDFGLAKLKGSLKLTKTSSTVGTLAYMAPEQIQGEAVDARSDIFSFGVVLYEMLTGHLPFRGEHEAAMMYSILNEEPTEITKLRPALPAGIRKIMKRALAKEPEQRYQRVEELAADLHLVRQSCMSHASDQQVSRRKHSIAVLPFVDMSPQKDQEYFCDGIAEELINALTHIKALRVAARTSAFSCKGEKYDVREIGDKLNVETVLEGSIRKAGNQLRITAQLVSAADGYHLWSEKYDRQMEDIFAIQDEITLAIVDKLKIELLGDEAVLLVKRGTDDLEAYELYAKGRFFWDQRGAGIGKAIEYFKRALARDPNYAQAYAGIADGYSLLGFYGFLPSKDAFPQAVENAKKALELDGRLAEAHSTLGFVHLFYDWDYSKAEHEFRKAIELNPGYAPAHYWYSAVLLVTGRSDEALRENERAIEVDPLSIQAHTQYGWELVGLRDYDRSITQLKRALELNPNYALAHWLLAMCHCHQSKYEDAIAESRNAVDLSGNNPWMMAQLGWVYGKSGRIAEARQVLTELTEKSKLQYVRPSMFAQIHMGLGEYDQAFTWLDRGYEERDIWMTILNLDPAFDDLRGDPRFIALIEKVNSGQ